MQAFVELLATVVVWMAVATLNHLGVKVDMPQPEAKAERVIQRESPKAQKEAAEAPPCPDAVTVNTKKPPASA